VADEVTGDAMTEWNLKTQFVPFGLRPVFERLGWSYYGDCEPPSNVAGEMYFWAGEGDPVYPGDEIGVEDMVKRVRDELEGIVEAVKDE
jgi:hypothetical protein